MENTTRSFNIVSGVIVKTDDYEGFKCEIAHKGEIFDETLNISKAEAVAKLNSRGINTDDLTNRDILRLLEATVVTGDITVKIPGDTFKATEYSSVEAEDSTPENRKYRKVKKSEIGTEFQVTQQGLYINRENFKFKTDWDVADKVEASVAKRKGSESIDDFVTRARLAGANA